jgi:hypothetical protein
LLTCSAATLDSFELAKLAAIANLRSELHDILDKLIDEGTQAGFARWFKTHEREEIKHALDNPPDLLAEARERIRTKGRSEEELVELLALPPGHAHRIASLTYQKRNVAEGKCCVCPRPLARNSVCYCERHLAIARARHKPVGGKGAPPGSRDFLYEGTFESGHGRQPGTLKALAEWREKQHRSSEAEKALYSRVATQLGITAEHVRQVALGQRRSKGILAALKEEIGPDPKKRAIADSAPSGLRSLAEKKRGRK